MVLDAAVLTQVDVGGPEARATLEADRALGHDGRVAVGPHQVVDLEQDLRPRKLQSACKVRGGEHDLRPSLRLHTEAAVPNPLTTAS